ncbi:MAG: DUF4097 family beta strand repeat protein [Clostridia bacterium]|nr:DUF4097 family beta strand repeat protein [Clostridia bacterium]
MKKSLVIWLAIGLSLVFIGLLAFGAAFMMGGFDFKELSLQKYVTNTYDIEFDFEKISIKTIDSDITFIKSDTDKCRVVFLENKKVRHSAVVKDGELMIESMDERKWYDYISLFDFENETIKLYLPKNIYDSLVIKTTTGDINISKNFAFNTVSITGSTADVEFSASSIGLTEIKLTTGDIEMENAAFGDLRLTVSTGDIEVDGVECKGDIYIKVSTGETELDRIACKNFTSEGTTGDIELSSVIASEKLDVRRSTGDIRFRRCDASEVYAKTATGDITGSLLSEKIFITESSTGSVRVPNSVSGGRCEIKTSTGDIRIEIAK